MENKEFFNRTSRVRKLICFCIFTAMAVSYIVAFHNQSLLDRHPVYRKQKTKLMPKYSKQSQSKTLPLKKITIGDNQGKATYTFGDKKSSWNSRKPTNIDASPVKRKKSRITELETKKNKKSELERLVKANAKRRSLSLFNHQNEELSVALRANDTDLVKSVQNSLLEEKYHGYHGIDLMTLKPFQFDPAFKNPCWTDGSTLRCLPYVFVIGVKKCGTSELWKLMSQHPDFVTGKFHKEAQWFARGRFHMGYGNFETYIDMFKYPALKIKQAYMENDAGEKFHPLITGEASPSNLHMNSHWRYLPGNEGLDEPKYVNLDYIHHFLPKAKIIIIFRDPVERLYSDYFHQYGKILRLNSSPEHFHELMVMGLQLYKECLQNRTLRSCVYDERIYETVGINIQLGIYHVYWKELTRLFPREQILMLQNSELQDETMIINKVFTFLDMRYLPNFQTRASSRPANSRRLVDAAKGDMLNETRKLLQDFYRPFNEEMFRITGDKRFLYDTNVS